MNDSTTNINFLRHSLATIQYRAQKAISDSPENFDTFSIGSGLRTPIEILSHIGDVLTYLEEKLRCDIPPVAKPVYTMTWKDQQNRFNHILSDLDHTLSSHSSIKNDTAHRSLQGPIADTLTHIGQLSMLRRLAGSPVGAENFFEANVKPLQSEGD